MVPATYVAQDYLIWHQWEGMNLIVWRLDAPEKGDARGVRQNSGGRLESTLLEAEGRTMK